MSIIQEGRTYLPSAPKSKQLLALFLLNVNVLVTIDACVEELWGSAPPKSALATLQTYVLQIRRVMRTMPFDNAGHDEPLQTRNQGYLFTAEPSDVDHLVFEHRVTRGRQAVRRGADAQASADFAEALDLWRDEVVSDVQIGPLLSVHRITLAETRLSVLELRIEADLRLGRHHLLLDELSMLSSENPRHENINAQYMIALFRSGYRTRALEVYDRLRRRLEVELGMEPSPQLQALYVSINDFPAWASGQ
ncbi:MAG: AfsR/SARP family transcriptional regulator [Actinophytocola sp.]|uniref:AfsR/SARP family transcriptional regulator n=1 Tax=Actinophytocola sp. TaxID=1872138 RepID=UPI003C76A576